jgi:S1-C subfamily serine protease
MTSRLWAAILAAPLLLMAGCTPVNQANPPGTITVNGVRYANVQAAVEAQRRLAEAGLVGLPHESDPLLGRVQIVLADRDRLRPYIVAHARNLPPAGIEYFIQVEDMLQHLTANALIGTHAFESSHMVEQNDTTNPDMGGADYIVWHQIYSLNNETIWGARWMVRRAGSTATRIALFDAGTKANSTARYESFLKSVRQAALQLGGKTAAGAKPTTVVAARGGTGSGIVVDAEHVLTNNHVVAACQTARVFDGAVTSDAPVVARDATNDLALVKISNHPRGAAAFRDSSGVRAGEAIVVTGFPLSGLVSTEMAITTGSVTALKGPKDDSRILQISAPIQPGNSGGPALDTDGDVIGIVSSTLNSLLVGIATGGVIPQGVNFAIKTGIVEEFLDANRVHYEKAAAHRELSTPDIADKARKFTVRVDCH